MKKIRFYFSESGNTAPETINYFVRGDGSVWRDNNRTCELQSFVVGFEDFIMPCPDVSWEIVEA